jgi:hypothetical protein
MNESGIFWDATSNPYQDLPYAEQNLQFYNGALMQKVMEECTTIDEVMSIFNTYYCQDQYRGQYLIGGAEGRSVIIDGDSMLKNDMGWQVLTNFHQSRPELGGYPCWRYETAGNMLGNCDGLTAYFAGSVLDATHQEGAYPTQYSLIFDPFDKQVILFYYHHFEEYLTVDLEYFFLQDTAIYIIPSLFSQVELISPTKGELITSDSVIMQWKGLPGSEYMLSLLDEDGRLVWQHTLPARPPHGKDSGIALFAGLMLLPLVMLRKRHLIRYCCILVITALSLQTSCKKNEDSTHQDAPRLHSMTVHGLQPGKTYHWYISASTHVSEILSTRSLSASFTTSSTFIQQAVGSYR